LKNSEKTRLRLDTVGKAIYIFEELYALGYKEKGIVFNQLLIYFPQYDTVKGQNDFTLLWGFKCYNNKLIDNLEVVLNKIKKQ